MTFRKNRFLLSAEINYRGGLNFPCQMFIIAPMRQKTISIRTDIFAIYID